MDVCCRALCPTGIDSEGHAANFVETEQIVLYEGAKASFVQASMRAMAYCYAWFVLHLSVQLLKMYLSLRGARFQK